MSHLILAKQAKKAKLLSMLLILLLGFPLQIVYATPVSSNLHNPGTTNNAFYSIFPEKPPKIDGIASSQEWSSAISMPLNIGGFLMVMNDYVNIYFLIDVTADTIADAIPNDYFWLTFDINQNGLIDANLDVMFSYIGGTTTPCVMQYLEPNSWTGCIPSDSTFKAGFGSTPNASTPHRFFELAISRAEISIFRCNNTLCQSYLTFPTALRSTKNSLYLTMRLIIFTN